MSDKALARLTVGHFALWGCYNSSADGRPNVQLQCASMLVKDVLRCMESLLKEEGFHAGPHGVLLRPIRSGFQMFVGLNTATHRGDGVIGINPVVGLREDAVENRVTELTGHRSIVTLSISLGYLMPERRYSIRTFGYPELRSLASREAVVAALKEGRMTINPNRAYRLPVAYLLQGRKT